MRKVALIWVIVIMVTGCRITKRSTIDNNGNALGNALTVISVADKNLSNNDFSVTRAEIIYSDKETRAELTANIKYKKEGNYLISLRAGTGIEIARIFISGDTILANDRIGKKLYYGSAQALEKKYGLSTKALPLIFGDMICGNYEKEKEIRCINGEGKIKVSLVGKEVNYLIDCSLSKTKTTEIKDYESGLSMNMEYRDFRNYDARTFPGNVIITGNREKAEIIISFRKIDFTDVQNMKFIPGEGYEKILLK